MKKLFNFTLLLGLFWGLSAGMCTKVVAYGTTVQTDAVMADYSSSVETTMESAKKALESLGYSVLDEDLLQRRITTGWVPTTSDSHYLPLFKRKDYGASVGGYYQLIIDFTEDASKIRVTAYTKVQSVSGSLSSSHVEEKKLLTRLGNHMRSPQIVITNVGVQER